MVCHVYVILAQFETLHIILSLFCILLLSVAVIVASVLVRFDCNCELDASVTGMSVVDLMRIVTQNRGVPAK